MSTGQEFFVPHVSKRLVCVEGASGNIRRTNMIEQQHQLEAMLNTPPLRVNGPLETSLQSVSDLRTRVLSWRPHYLFLLLSLKLQLLRQYDIKYIQIGLKYVTYWFWTELQVSNEKWAFSINKVKTDNCIHKK